MEVSLAEAIEAYKNYDSERTPCRICNRSFVEMAPIFPFEAESMSLLRYCLIFEFMTETKSIFICTDCNKALAFCAKNINLMRQRRHLFPSPNISRHCWLCRSGRCVRVIIPENSSKQVVFQRLMGSSILGNILWICSPCSDLINDLDELLQVVHETEVAMSEGIKPEENRLLLNHESSSDPLRMSTSKPCFKFMSTDMAFVLNIGKPKENEATISLEDVLQFNLEMNDEELTKATVANPPKNLVGAVKPIKQASIVLPQNSANQNDNPVFSAVPQLDTLPIMPCSPGEMLKYGSKNAESLDNICCKVGGINLNEGKNIGDIKQEVVSHKKLDIKGGGDVEFPAIALKAESEKLVPRKIAKSADEKEMEIYKKHLAQRALAKKYLNTTWRTTIVEANYFDGKKTFYECENFGLSTQKPVDTSTSTFQNSEQQSVDDNGDDYDDDDAPPNSFYADPPSGSPEPFMFDESDYPGFHTVKINQSADEIRISTQKPVDTSTSTFQNLEQQSVDDNGNDDDDEDAPPNSFYADPPSGSPKPFMFDESDYPGFHTVKINQSADVIRISTQKPVDNSTSTFENLEQQSVDHNGNDDDDEDAPPNSFYADPPSGSPEPFMFDESDYPGFYTVKINQSAGED